MTTTKPKMSISEAISWYSEKRPVYEQLSKKVESIIQEIIADQGIPIHAIYSRAKDVDSFAKKIEDPKYTDPIVQITDFSGIRVITYVESDVEKVSKVLEAHFEIDPDNSIDKSKSLGVDKVGYRSIHYIAKLPSDRIKLPEYKKFSEMVFEIQIRTILQHAWAEIEHDKDYKFSGELPNYLKRRFKVLAGVLELADREFNGIATEIDSYSNSVIEDTKKGNLDLGIDSTSIKSYLNLKFEDLIKNGLNPDFLNNEIEKMVLSELRSFGISTIQQLDEIIPADYVERVLKFERTYLGNQYNYIALLRDLMMIADSKKYFDECWQNNWDTTYENTVELIKSYNSGIEKELVQHNIFINS